MSKILTCVLSGIMMFTAVGVHAAEKGGALQSYFHSETIRVDAFTS